MVLRPPRESTESLWSNGMRASIISVGRSLPVVAAGGPLRLRTLNMLRWLAVTGQAGALVVVGGIMGFALPLFAAALCVLASALLNFVLHIAYPSSKRLSEREASLYLAYDVLQLAALLYLTGGLHNPFSFLILVPVTISASVLGLRATIGLGALALACISVLAVFHLPLPWRDASFVLEPIYLAGIWTSLVLGMGFIVVYAWRVAAEARRLADAYGATREALAKEQRLSALGALAAAAAHELGTPLATIAVVARELQDELGTGPHRDDVGLLVSQSKRCREILQRLARRPEQPDETPYSRMPLTALIEAAAAPHASRGIPCETDADGDGPEPQVPRSPEILHGVGNLVENAIRHAGSRVDLMIDWDMDHVVVAVRDDGPGFSPEILASLGEPYITSRRGEGLGLGVFIAATLLAHSGAEVAFLNRLEGGAEVAIRWPRRIFDAEQENSPGKGAPEDKTR